MATDFTQIDLNDGQRQLLASAADHLGMPWPLVFEQAIAPLTNSESTKSNGGFESAYEILSRLGLIGCISGTPHDLSTNKKYMEGYGQDA